MKNSYAPILITTLNRFEHFTNCVESLKKCKLSGESDLFIALDYPLLSIHREGYLKILRYIDSIDGFRSINIIRRSYNFGSFNNSQLAIESIFERFESVICTEDDNVFSEDFLVFINQALSSYKDNKDIFSVCGYAYPVEINHSVSSDIYFWNGYSAWGVGLWREKYNLINWDWGSINKTIHQFFKNPSKIYNFSKISDSYIPALLNMYNNKIIHGDIYISLFLFLRGMYSVFPINNRVRNYGHDGSGLNCGIDKENIYSKQGLNSNFSPLKLPETLIIDSNVYETLRRYGKTSFIQKVKTFCKVLIVILRDNFEKTDR